MGSAKLLQAPKHTTTRNAGHQTLQYLEETE
jgi:hypothetical protein